MSATEASERGKTGQVDLLFGFMRGFFGRWQARAGEAAFTTRLQMNPSIPTFIVALGACLCPLALSALNPTTQPMNRNLPPKPDGLAPGWTVGQVLFEQTFDDEDLDAWTAELESGGEVTAEDGKLEIDVPGGASIWFEPLIEGPVLIEYEATVIDAGGPNDRVSDLNCFWMARDARNEEDLFATKRSGKFADYNELKCYYVGLGGNSNGTTRFRRYIGHPQRRPLLPEHDLTAERYMITPNVKQTIRLIAADGQIEYWRDDENIFDYDDPKPYTSGWFAFRTVANHMTIDNFRVYRLERRGGAAEEKPVDGARPDAAARTATREKGQPALRDDQ